MNVKLPEALILDRQQLPIQPFLIIKIFQASFFSFGCKLGWEGAALSFVTLKCHEEVKETKEPYEILGGASWSSLIWALKDEQNPGKSRVREKEFKACKWYEGEKDHKEMKDIVQWGYWPGSGAFIILGHL